MRKLLIFISFMGTLALMYVLIYLAVSIPSFNMWFYKWQFEQNETYAYVGMDSEHLEEVTQHMINYLQGESDRDTGLQIMTVVSGVSRPFFSDLEIRHMIDVYDLFTKARVGLGLSMIYLSGFILILFKLKRTYWRLVVKTIRNTYFLISTSLCMLSLLIALNWRKAFVIFHEMFFNNDDWVLNPSVDLLIRIVPNKFFMSISSVIGLIFIVELFAIFLVTTFILKKYKN